MTLRLFARVKQTRVIFERENRQRDPARHVARATLHAGQMYVATSAVPKRGGDANLRAESLAPPL